MDSSTNGEPDQVARRVFLAHGKDTEVIGKVADILKQLGLKFVEWEELVSRLGRPSPFTFEVVKQALDDNMVFVVLFTPDEAVVLADHLDCPFTDNGSDDRAQLQARPNVLIEAGMALATSLERTVIVFVGQHRRISDLDGLNVVRTQDQEWAFRLAQRLRIAFENAGQTLSISQRRLNKLKRVPPMNRPEDNILYPAPAEVAVKIPTPTVTAVPPPGTLEPDPVNRCERLLAVFREYGGPTSARWRFDTKAPDYKVMKEAEAEDKRNPLKEGSRVYVQQHYESEYNGKIGTVKRYSPAEHFCSVEFPPETGLARKTFHVMYLSRCK